MIEGVEAIGEAVTGGAIARAVEPGAGEGQSGHAANCLNCGTALIGEHCHRCGQAAHVHRTLTAWWHDLAHGVLHLDGKIWRTLPLLVWKPGELTRRYIEGERAKFVSPMALFLFSVFMMFAVFSAVGGPFSIGLDPEQFRNSRSEIDSALAHEQQELRELREERAEEIRTGETADAARTAEEIKETERGIAAIENAARVVPGGNAQFVGGTTGWKAFDEGAKKLNANPSLLAYKLQNNAYKFSWALIPISVPFVWLLFAWRRRFKVYDHTVFVTYSLSFMTLLLVALSFVRIAGPTDDLIELAIMLVPPLHMYRQLKGAYGLTRFKALWRTLMLTIFALVALACFFALLVVIGVAG